MKWILGYLHGFIGNIFGIRFVRKNEGMINFFIALIAFFALVKPLMKGGKSVVTTITNKVNDVVTSTVDKVDKETGHTNSTSSLADARNIAKQLGDEFGAPAIYWRLTGSDENKVIALLNGLNTEAEVKEACKEFQAIYGDSWSIKFCSMETLNSKELQQVNTIVKKYWF